MAAPAEIKVEGRICRGDLYPHYYEGILTTPKGIYLIRPLLEIEKEGVVSLLHFFPEEKVAAQIAHFIQCHRQGIPFSAYPIYHRTSHVHLKPVHQDHTLIGVVNFVVKAKGYLEFRTFLGEDHKEVFPAVLVWVKSFLREMANRNITVDGTALSDATIQVLPCGPSQDIKPLEEQGFRPIYEIPGRQFLQ